jgi:chemotaxis family two-component system sensor kinase Cph1
MHQVTFVEHGVTIDLTNCDREPIHVPGQIQAHGVLLAVDQATRRVVQVSDNVEHYLGLPPQSVLGRTASEVLGALVGSALQQVLTPEHPENVPTHVFQGMVAGRGPFDVIAHRSGSLVVIEAERPSDAPAPPDFYATVSAAFARLQGAASLREYFDVLALTIRQLTGYDRVMIYRFADDWSGEVAAESMDADKGLAPFLGLRYPASDIPAQARALFLKNNVRMLPDASYVQARIVPERSPLTGELLDLSHAFLRGASQMYTEYLVNMGVVGTLTLALTDHDRLWGLVACHHYSPRRISHSHRLVCDLLARFASLQLADKSRNDEAEYRRRILDVHRSLVEALASQRSFGEAMANARDQLREFVDAAGVTIVSRGECFSDGAVPPREHVERISHLLAVRSDPGAVLATDRLASFYSDAAAIVDVAAGMLVLPLADSADDVVIWWRPEVARTVSWAGDPHKPVTIGPMGDRLTPRKSFALWVEEVRGSSLPWSRLERESAEALRTSLVELLARRHLELDRLASELRRSNSELEAFAYIASHDLKEPLRGIYNHCTFLIEDAKERLVAQDLKRFGSILRLVERTRALIDALLEYSRLGRIELETQPVDLGVLVAGCVEDSTSTIAEQGAEVVVDPSLPTIVTTAPLVHQIVSNLLSNSLKYVHAGEPPRVHIGFLPAGHPEFPARAAGHRYAFHVSDQGIGVPQRLQETAFQIFRRLHVADAYGGGSGAGLTIVRRAARRLGGDAWFDDARTVGARVWFVLDDAS